MKTTKLSVLLSLMVLLCLITGCGNQYNTVTQNTGNDSYITTETQTDTVYAQDTTLCLAAETSLVQPVDASATGLNPDTEIFDGSELSLWYGTENTLLIQKEKELYLYDATQANILAKGNTKQWDSACFMIRAWQKPNESTQLP